MMRGSGRTRMRPHTAEVPARNRWALSGRRTSTLGLPPAPSNQYAFAGGQSGSRGAGAAHLDNPERLRQASGTRKQDGQ
jgi:hypothetical protein